MKNKGITMLMLMIMLFSSVSSSIVMADETEQKNFSITPLDEKTLEPQTSYYDLTVSPATKRDLIIRVNNPNDEAIKIRIEANNGSTNDNGITSYVKQEKRDETLKVAFSDMAKVAQEIVTIPANQTTDVKIPVTIPTESFKGTVLGGIHFAVVEDGHQKKKDSATVKSTISYTIGVVLKETDDIIAPVMKLKTIKADQRNGRNYISANLQNEAPRIIKKLKVHAQVYKEKGAKILYERKAVDLRMAPNSNFNYGISLEDQPLIADKYRMEIEGTADDVPFSFTETFEIANKDAKSLNKNAVYVESSLSIVTWILIGLLVCIIVGVVVYLRQFKKRKGENSDG